MILRRITEHVRAQNWFAVGIDFLIVVVGVFVGLQVSNWNDARVETELEQEVLASVLQDIRSDRVELSSGASIAQVNIGASNYALEKAGLKSVQTLTMPVEDIPALSGFKFDIPAPRQLTPEETTRLWSLSTVRLFPTQANSAYEALVAAGDLSLISSTDLVRDLQQYSQQWASLENSQNRSYRPFRDQAIYAGQEFGLSPFVELDEAEYFALLASNPKLSSALRTLLEYAIIHHSQMERVDKMAAELISRLELEIQP